jgi:hypothetical protein
MCIGMKRPPSTSTGNFSLVNRPLGLGKALTEKCAVTRCVIPVATGTRSFERLRTGALGGMTENEINVGHAKLTSTLTRGHSGLSTGY